MTTVDTTELTITRTWSQISDRACEVQSMRDVKAYDKILFDLFISDVTVPDASTTAFNQITLHQYSNFNHESPIWLRLPKDSARESETVVITK